MTIPHSITDAGLVFIARGRPYQVAKDHAAFGPILKALSNEDDCRAALDQVSDDDLQDVLIRFVDFAGDIQRRSGGRIRYVGDSLVVDDTTLPEGEPWTRAIRGDPDLLRILLVREGDLIAVAGDEDLPDGTYTVSGIDLTDAERTLYVESEEACFWGYVPNVSVRDWIPHAMAHMADDAA